jgi:hypothetical protein
MFTANTLVTGTSWAAGVVTFATDIPSGIITGAEIVVVGSTPAGYNGTFTVTGTPTPITLTAAMSVNPTAWRYGGTVTSGAMDWNSPSVSVRSRELAFALDPDALTPYPTNLPNKAMRFNVALAKWQRYMTGTWDDPVVAYAISITGNAATATNATNASNVPYTGLTGTVPTWNQNTTGTSANITGVAAIANGGTGQITAPLALTAIGGAALAGSASQRFSVADATLANHAVAFDQVIGLGQTWTDVLAGRAVGGTYTNSTGKLIIVSLHIGQSVAASYTDIFLTTGGYAHRFRAIGDTLAGGEIQVIVPIQAGDTYILTVSGPAAYALISWWELR